ncbi:MAG: HemK/PrmC family methyltransferase [Planctomycetota bacterium]
MGVLIREILVSGAEVLATAGIGNAPAEAARLLAHAAGVRVVDLHGARGEAAVTPEAGDRYSALIARRRTHYPLQYLLGMVEFYGRPFRVREGALIPRPETEGVVEEALRFAQGSSLVAREPSLAETPFRVKQPDGRDAVPVCDSRRAIRDSRGTGHGPRVTGHGMRIMDVGTGSGILAVTLALELPSARVWASDISGAALELARENVEALGCPGRVEFRQGDLFEAFAGDALADGVDIIVSNPPYIPFDMRADLMPEVRDFEPPEALFAGGDGLDIIRRVAAGAPRFLRSGGALVLEIGIGQSDAVAGFLREAGFTGVRVTPDLAGIPRVAVGTSCCHAVMPS